MSQLTNPVVGPAAATKDESLLFPAAGSNVAVTKAVVGDDAAFDACEVVVEQDIVNQRLACLPMEARATAATFENGRLTVWHSLQNAAGQVGDPQIRHRGTIAHAAEGTSVAEDIRASRAYREHLARVLVSRTPTQAAPAQEGTRPGTAQTLTRRRVPR
jgi:hypothetical protein